MGRVADHGSKILPGLQLKKPAPLYDRGEIKAGSPLEGGAGFFSFAPLGHQKANIPRQRMQNPARNRMPASPVVKVRPLSISERVTFRVWSYRKMKQ